MSDNPPPHKVPDRAGGSRWHGFPRRRAVVVVGTVFAAAAVPLGLIRAGMSPEMALATAGAVAGFAVGVTHQILGLINGATRPGAPSASEESR